MQNLFNDVVSFLNDKFPNSNLDNHLLKLEKEVKEVKETPYDIYEYSDCLLALFASVNKAGFTFEQFIDATSKKMEIVKKRTWDKLPDGTYQHQKENMPKGAGNLVILKDGKRGRIFNHIEQHEGKIPVYLLDDKFAFKLSDKGEPLKMLCSPKNLIIRGYFD